MDNKKPERTIVTFTLTDEVEPLLVELTKRYHASRSEAIRLAIRDAYRMNVQGIGDVNERYLEILHSTALKTKQKTLKHDRYFHELDIWLQRLTNTIEALHPGALVEHGDTDRE